MADNGIALKTGDWILVKSESRTTYSISKITDVTEEKIYGDWTGWETTIKECIKSMDNLKHPIDGDAYDEKDNTFELLPKDRKKREEYLIQQIVLELL